MHSLACSLSPSLYLIYLTRFTVKFLAEFVWKCKKILDSDFSLSLSLSLSLCLSKSESVPGILHTMFMKYLQHSAVNFRASSLDLSRGMILTSLSVELRQFSIDLNQQTTVHFPVSSDPKNKNQNGPGNYEGTFYIHVWLSCTLLSYYTCVNVQYNRHPHCLHGHFLLCCRGSMKGMAQP